jgi:hypothetical protein
MPNLDMPTRLLIPGDSLIFGATNHLVNTVDFSSATWNTVASHEVFTVTGTVRMRVLQLCTETLTDAADAATIQYGVAGTTDALIAATNAAGAGGSTIEAGEMWVDASPADTYGDFATVILDKVITNGLDVGYEIAGEALTDGIIEFHCWWEPISSDGNVVVGAGGSL